MDKIYVGLGGAVGSLIRYLLSLFVKNFPIATFPIGTFIINVTGCFLIGFINTKALEKFVISPPWRLALTTGLLGGYTTFSTFSFETVNLWNTGEITNSILYSIGSILIGLIAAWLGVVLARNAVEYGED